MLHSTVPPGSTNCPLLRYYVIYREKKIIQFKLPILILSWLWRPDTETCLTNAQNALYVSNKGRKGQHCYNPILIHGLPSHRLRGTDLAPSSGIHGTSISTERIPKSAARVLDAARIRAEYRQKRARLKTDEANDGMSASKPPPPKKHRTNVGEADAGKSGKTLAKGKDKPVGMIEIQPGESLKHFNRCAFLALLHPKGESVSHDCTSFALFFLHIQKSRGPYASAGTISCAGFGCDGAQGKESSDGGCLLP